MNEGRPEDRLERERVANRRKHWVRLATACNSHCLFCLDSDTPRNLFVPREDVLAELRRGREELDADKVILSGGEASLHPEFFDLIGEARKLGYERVQTVTNGWMFGQRSFFLDAVAAGLGEITFSLHGDSAALHDHLTQTEGAFDRIVKAIARAVRTSGLITNVDVVINRQNVARIDKIIELAIELGVREFDLLHVIPQANAFDHRDELFYDPKEHLPVLHKVFRLNRHKGFVIWTNRFPVPYLEGLEDLVQDPHKMLDEVNGRRFQVRRYLDDGVALDCRQPERCVHCFIEPFCTTTDRVIADIAQENIEGLDLGTGPLPPAWPLGVDRVRITGAAGARWEAVPPGILIEVVLVDPTDAALLPTGVVIEAASVAVLDAFLGSRPLVIPLGREQATWMLAHRERLEDAIGSFEIIQPTWATLAEASAHDVRDPAAFFQELGLAVPVRGLPPCAAAPAHALVARRWLSASIWDAATGRLAVRALAEHHVARGYFARSVRCADCAVVDRCEGLHVNMIRDQGLRLCRPLASADGIDLPRPSARVAQGRVLVDSSPSLPGFPAPGPVASDPLAALVLRKERERALRRLPVVS